MVFNTLPAAFKQLMVVVGWALRTGTRTAYRALETAAHALWTCISLILRVLCLPLTMAAWAVHLVGRWGVRYLKLLLVAVCGTVAVLGCLQDSSLKMYAGESLNGAGTSTPHSVTNPLTTTERLKYIQKIFLRRAVAPFAELLQYQLPQLTYEMLRLWHIMLLHGASSLMDWFVASILPAVRKLLSRMGVTADPTSTSTTSTTFRDSLQKALPSNENAVVEAYFRTWDRLGKLHPAFVDQMISRETGDGDQRDGDQRDDTATTGDAKPTSNTPPPVTNVLFQNDTRKLSLHQAQEQLLRPWKVVGTRSGMVPKWTELYTKYTKWTQKNSSTLRTLHNTTSSVTQPVTIAATDAATWLSNRVGKLPTNAITMARKQIVARCQKNIKWFYGNIGTDNNADGENALTVCALMSMFFGIAGTTGVVREVGQVSKAVSASGALWTRVPEEVVVLTYLDCSV